MGLPREGVAGTVGGPLVVALWSPSMPTQERRREGGPREGARRLVLARALALLAVTMATTPPAHSSAEDPCRSSVPTALFGRSQPQPSSSRLRFPSTPPCPPPSPPNAPATTITTTCRMTGCRSHSPGRYAPMQPSSASIHKRLHPGHAPPPTTGASTHPLPPPSNAHTPCAHAKAACRGLAACGGPPSTTTPHGPLTYSVPRVVAVRVAAVRPVRVGAGVVLAIVRVLARASRARPPARICAAAARRSVVLRPLPICNQKRSSGVCAGCRRHVWRRGMRGGRSSSTSGRHPPPAQHACP